jgi:hypothetical protein
MVTTGYADTFNRTIVNGFGFATSGQGYAVTAPAASFSVAPNTASLAITTGGEHFAVIDLQTQNLDITGQVALSSIPVTNLCTVGFASKLSSNTDYFSGTMMVAAGGAISLRFSKLVAGSLVTIASVATGLTYVANTFYNLRYQIYWSRPLQTNVMSLKLWAVGATEPGGWMATATDASMTDYTSGTQVGPYARDESAVIGTITAKWRSILARSYNLPIPSSADPMCYDPGVTYPRQTALESLADAADAAMASLDPFTSLAGLFPRVRISNTNLLINTATFTIPTFSATEFNIGTDTNLGYDNTSLYLPVGIWLTTFEIKFAEAASNYFGAFAFGGSPGNPGINLRSNAAQSNDDGTGGTGHLSAVTVSTDPTTPIKYGVSLLPNNLATTYTIKYMALSAIKVSDYFT